MLSLLFPCCSSKKGVEVEIEQTRCSQLSTHIITSLVVAIIGGAGAAAAAYFLTQQTILWTAVAGGGTFAVVAMIAYVALR